MKTLANITYGHILPLVLVVFFMGLSTNAPAQNIISDYQIQQDFKNMYKAINDSLEVAQETKQVKRLVKKIKRLEEKYRDHRELLNKALYPETFNEEMTDVKRSAVSMQRHLATIERQEAKLDTLTAQLSSYTTRLDALNLRTDSLRTAMQQSIQSESELSALVRQYRRNLEKRDDLILSFVDSVLVTYQQMDMESMQELENARNQSRLNAEGNALKMIEGIARQNVEFLNSNPRLSTEAYLRMNAVQQQFEHMWNKLGDKIADIYGGGDASEAKEQVNSAISKWNEKITNKTWASLNQAINETEINLPEFASQEAFYNSLNNYLNKVIKASKENGSEEAYKEYQHFNSFWTNQVQLKWSDYLEEGDILSNQQIAAVSQKLDQWAINAEPDNGNLLVYLLGASVLAIVVLGIMLVREKNTHS